MGIISVTLQDRMNPRVYEALSDGNVFLCPVCKENHKEVWVKKYHDFQNTFITRISHCDECGNSFSMNR